MYLDINCQQFYICFMRTQCYSRCFITRQIVICSYVKFLYNILKSRPNIQDEMHLYIVAVYSYGNKYATLRNAIHPSMCTVAHCSPGAHLVQGGTSKNKFIMLVHWLEPYTTVD